MEKNKSISYFPGLSALRFIAASLVIVHHVEQYKSWAGYANIWGNPVIDSLGHKSVSFFFVLSGFLITYLLLAENRKNGQINLGRFYMRRILRIWPLYFLIVAVSVALIPFLIQNVFESASISVSVVMCFLLFVPNMLRISAINIAGANQLWSVGVEEQFYLFWPILIKRFINKIIPFLVGFVILKFTFHVLLLSGLKVVTVGPLALRLAQFERLYALFPVEQMAVGGLGAALLYYGKEQLLNWIYSPTSIVLSFALITYTSLKGIHFLGITYVEAVAFTSMIMGICKYPALHKPLENKLFRHLGNISYGIYMWHTAVISVLIVVMHSLQVEFGAVANITLHVMSIGGTLLVSHFSYQYFELPFLKLKERFSFDQKVVKSRAA